MSFGDRLHMESLWAEVFHGLKMYSTKSNYTVCIGLSGLHGVTKVSGPRSRTQTQVISCRVYVKVYVQVMRGDQVMDGMWTWSTRSNRFSEGQKHEETK